MKSRLAPATSPDTHFLWDGDVAPDDVTIGLAVEAGDAGSPAASCCTNSDR